MAGWPHGDPDAVVKSVLSQPAYRQRVAETSQPPQESWLEIAWDWIVDHILRPIFHPLADAMRATSGISGLVGDVLIVASVALLAFLIYRLVIAFARTGGPKRAGNQATALAIALSSQRWKTLARERASRGDYAGAIAALFSSALAALDERAIVAFDAARTPGEYRRMVRAAQREASVGFDDLSGRFVRAAYAEVPAHASDFEAAERALAEFEPALEA